jgi:putative membrane protein
VRRGSLAHRIYGQQLFILALSCAVVLAHGQLFLWKVPLIAGPFSLMGISFAIFLGFRINASYDRFWEARKQWGSVLVEARNQLRGLPANLHTEALPTHALRSQIGSARSAPTLVPLWLGHWLHGCRKDHLLEPVCAYKGRTTWRWMPWFAVSTPASAKCLGRKPRLRHCRMATLCCASRASE